MVQGQRHGGPGAGGAAGGVAGGDAPRDGAALHGPADALRHQYGPAAGHGAVDAGGADDDPLLGRVHLPRAGRARLRPAPAAAPRNAAAHRLAGVDGRHLGHLGTAVGVGQVHPGAPLVRAAVLLRLGADLPPAAAHTPVLLGLRHRAGRGDTDCHLEDAGQLQRPSNPAPRDEALLQRPHGLRLRHRADAAGGSVLLGCRDGCLPYSS